MGDIVFFSVLLVVCIVFLYFLIDEDEAGLSSMVTFLAFLLAVILIADITEFTPRERSVSEYTVTKEVRKLDVNGAITEIDTVYIFTKKKN